jgi:hypothetical protein
VDMNRNQEWNKMSIQRAGPLPLSVTWDGDIIDAAKGLQPLLARTRDLRFRITNIMNSTKSYRFLRADMPLLSSFSYDSSSRTRPLFPLKMLEVVAVSGIIKLVLENVHISSSDFDFVHLRHLELSTVYAGADPRRLLDFIKQCQQLEYLYLRKVKKITTLEDFDATPIQFPLLRVALIHVHLAWMLALLQVLPVPHEQYELCVLRN